MLAKFTSLQQDHIPIIYRHITPLSYKFKLVLHEFSEFGSQVDPEDGVCVKNPEPPPMRFLGLKHVLSDTKFLQ